MKTLHLLKPTNRAAISNGQWIDVSAHPRSEKNLPDHDLRWELGPGNHPVPKTLLAAGKISA